MELREELIEKVERYLSGELSRKELKEGEDSALSDEEIDDAIELLETSRSLIELNGLRKDLQSIHEDYIADSVVEEKEEKPVFNLRIWASLAVAAALLAIAIFSGVFRSESPGFDDYFEAYPDIISMRGAGADLSEAMRYYSLANYEAALNEFSKIQTDTLNDTLLFYEAVAALATKNFTLAAKNLETLSGMEKNTYWQQTVWYLGLTYWQLGRLEEAEKVLSTISTGQKDYDKAQEILKGF